MDPSLLKEDKLAMCCVADLGKSQDSKERNTNPLAGKTATIYIFLFARSSALGFASRLPRLIF